MAEQRVQIVFVGDTSSATRAIGGLERSFSGLARRLVPVTEAQLPLLQYWASDPLPLDVHTYRGDDVIGAEPLRAEPS